MDAVAPIISNKVGWSGAPKDSVASLMPPFLITRMLLTLFAQEEYWEAKCICKRRLRLTAAIGHFLSGGER
jgi:hypothetical protein